MLNITDVILPGESRDDGLVYSLQCCRPNDGDILQTRNSLPVALVFVHGVSLHKEAWLPLIERLFAIQAAAGPGALHISEAWTIDLINHGQAGHMNERSLLRYPETFGGNQSNRMLRTLLGSGLIQEGASIVAVGHSGGAVAMVLSTIGYPLWNLPYTSVIVIEPAMMPRSVYAGIFSEPTPWVTVMEATKSRKDIWPTREAAREWFGKRLPWSRWHPRSLDLFVEKALRQLPTATYPDVHTGVTLSCTRKQESLSYSRFEDCVDSLERLRELSTVIPVHCILGSVTSIVSHKMRQGIFDICRGESLGSVTVLEGVGHFIVQEDPDRLANTIWGALNKQTFASRSRL
ncbi:alpha/beta-hydrolase [Artomyces pyxidatus]|uniref:Alpha/beta-hydrolase n=1 Tax=Artomyces pyxidatus TaxID=48021 RepID=A0ACB8T6Y9_9AGAM|nr:alpha/beta-hydrolase [Artomyces pyxidatus]